MIITSPEQIRAARVLLRLDQTEFARRARVSLATLRRVESSADKPHASVRAVASIQHALEAAGVEFIENGVRRRRSRSREEVEERVRRIMEIARQSGDKQSAAVYLNAIAIIARDRGDLTVARSLLEESLMLWRELGDQKSVARSLSNLANIVKMQGDNAGASSLYGEGLSIFRRIGDWTGVAWSMNYQGDVARHFAAKAASGVFANKNNVVRINT